MVCYDCAIGAYQPSHITYNLGRITAFVDLIPAAMVPMLKPTSVDSKDELLPSITSITLSTGSAEETRSTKWKYLACTVLGSLALLHILRGLNLLPLDPLFSRFDAAPALCPQEEALYPVKGKAIFQSLTEIYGTQEFKTRATDWVNTFAPFTCDYHLTVF